MGRTDAAGSESVLLQPLRNVQVYLASSFWLRRGCGRPRHRTQSTAGVFSVPKTFCFLNATRGFSLLDLLRHSHPLLGLRTQTGSLSCMVTPQSFVLTDPKPHRLLGEKERVLGNVWISFHNRSPRGSCL